MVEELSLRMRIADGVSMLSRAGGMLGVSGAFKSKLRQARHRAKASRVPKLSRFMEIIENIDLYDFVFLMSGEVSNLSRAVGEISSSGAHLSMQNDLAYLTESARFPIRGLRWELELKTCVCIDIS